MSRTFNKGVFPSHNKKLTENLEIENVFEPKTVYISLSPHIGKPAECIVEAGQRVLKGQLIGKAQPGLSANIFSSVSGTVKGIVKRNNVIGKKADHVEIENDFLEESTYLPSLKSPSADEIKKRIFDAGIIGMGGAGFPTHIKLNPPKEYEFDTLIINAAECEPYITCDYRVMLEYTEDFIKGVLLLKKASGAKTVIIGIEDNKMPVINHLLDRDDTVLIKCHKKASQDKINIMKLKSKYPQGAEKQLIYATVKRIVPEGGLPSHIGVLVDNVHTALSIYYAVEKGIPLFDRVMTVSGTACDKPCNMWVKTGTSYKDIEEHCNKNENLEMIISGGPMMGFTVFSDEVCVTATTGSVLFLAEKEIDFVTPSACIACSKCVEVCPMELMPVFIDSNVLTGNYKEAKKYGAMSCIECGCCSFICPAKKPLVQSIKLAKKIIRERKL